MHTSTKLISGLNDLISFKKQDRFFNHIVTFIRNDYKSYYGNITHNEFRIWKLNRWNKVFYHVIYGSVIINNSKPNININTKINSLGLCLEIVFMAGLSILIIDGVVIQENNEWKFLWKRILAGLFILCLPLIVIGIGYREGRRTAIEDFQKDLSRFVKIGEN